VNPDQKRSKPTRLAWVGVTSRAWILLLAWLLCNGSMAAESRLDQLVDLMVGEYRSVSGSVSGLAPGSATMDGQPMQDRRLRVNAPQLGEHVIYLQVNTGPELEKIYRQRIFVFREVPGSAEIQQISYSFKHPEPFADAAGKPNHAAEQFLALDENDFEATLPDHCVQTWHQPDGQGDKKGAHSSPAWVELVSPDRCRIWSERSQAWRRIGSETRLFPDRIEVAERGFDDAGEQVFGTPPGEFLVLPRVVPAGQR